jgi:hypothetical protein
MYLVDLPLQFLQKPDSMNNAAERLLGLMPEQIQELSKDIFIWSIAFGNCYHDY